MTQSDVTGLDTAMNEAPTERAFLAISPEIEALPDTPVPVNIDLVGAATTVLGLLPELRGLRAQIAEELKRFDLERFDKLERYALALIHAHGLHRGSTAAKANTAELGAELAAIRDRLFITAQALVVNGLLDGARLAQCKTATGYRATAADVFTLVPLFKEHWARIEQKMPVSLAELNRASSLAVELLAQVGLKEQGPVAVGEAAQTRAKAYVLFARAYEDARRAVQYLRAEHGDADDITPSLYAGRGGRGKGDGAAAGAEGGAAAAGDGEASAAPSSGNDAGSDRAPAVRIANPHNLPINNPLTS